MKKLLTCIISIEVCCVLLLSSCQMDIPPAPERSSPYDGRNPDAVPEVVAITVGSNNGYSSNPIDIHLQLRAATEMQVGFVEDDSAELEGSWIAADTAFALSDPGEDGTKWIACCARALNGRISQTEYSSFILDTHCSIDSFFFTTSASNVLDLGDEITFVLQLAPDLLGLETGGDAILTVTGWEPLALSDGGDGNYQSTMTVTENTPEVTFALVQAAFTDRAGNSPVSVGASERLSIRRSKVYVPTSEFTMGSDAIGGYAIPEHDVSLDSYFIDKYEVTNAQYRVFCDATGHDYPPDPGFIGIPNYFTNPIYDNYPVVMVSWNDARDYAMWAGKRLPSEAEWERAAKGDTDNRQWPWGDIWVAEDANVYNNPTDGYDYTAPVGIYTNGVSPVGCYDMVGNVWEWCEDDWHSNYNGAPTDGSAWIDNPRTSYRVKRGGSWTTYYSYARCACRGNYNQANHDNHLGFRCAMTP